jgi:hypothetical protein
MERTPGRHRELQALMAKRVTGVGAAGGMKWNGEDGIFGSGVLDLRVLMCKKAEVSAHAGVTALVLGCSLPRTPDDHPRILGHIWGTRPAALAETRRA